MKEILNYLKEQFPSYDNQKNKHYANALFFCQNFQFYLKPWGENPSIRRKIVLINVKIDFLNILCKFIHSVDIIYISNEKNELPQKLNVNVSLSKIKPEEIDDKLNLSNRLNLIIYDAPENELKIKKINGNSNSIIISIEKATSVQTLSKINEKVISKLSKKPFGYFFDSTKNMLIKSLPNKFLDEIEFSEKYNKKSEIKYNWDFIGVPFNSNIRNEIKKYGDKKFLSPIGKYIFIKSLKTKNQIIIDDDQKLVLNTLMPHNLAMGFDNLVQIYEDLKNFSLKKKTFFSFVKNKFFNKNTNIDNDEPKYFLSRISSPALSHWLMDVLIPYLSIRQIYPDLPMLYPGTLVSYQKNHLILLDIPNSKVIEINNNKILEYKNCITQTPYYHIDPVFAFASISSPVIKKEMLKLNKRLNSSKRELLYVSRKDAKNARILINEEDLENILVSKGFKIVIGSNHSDTELIEIYSKAKIIVGSLGAGLLNSIFSKDGVSIIALTSPSYYECHVAQIASLKCNNVKYIIGEEITSFDPKEGGSRNSNFFIPEKILLKEIDNCLKN